MANRSAELNILIRAKNLASAAIAGVKKDLKGLDKTIGKGLSTAWSNLERGVAIGAGAAAAGLGYAVKQAADFEAQLNTINTVAKLTGDAFSGALGKVGDQIRAISRATGTTTEELTSAYYDLVSAGISAADATDVLTNANKLAIGGLSTTQEAVDLLTTAINSYGGDASKASLYADQLAQAVNAGKVTVAEISESFSVVAPLAASMGVGVDEISAALAQMTSKGTPAAEAMTQMRAAMVALQRQTPDMTKVLKNLGITNVQAEVDSRGLVAVWNDLRGEADRLGIPLIKLTGRVEGTQFALQNTGPEFDRYNANLEKVRDSSGEAAAQMAERQKGLTFQLNRLKANVKDAAITIGSALIPQLADLAEAATGWIENHQPQIKQFAKDLANGLRDAVAWAKSLDWEGIGNSLKMAADFGKGLVQAFLAMPDWVKQAVITGWGLNKLTGGMVGSIVGQLASGLVKGVLGMNAGVVNINAGVVNGAGGVGAGAGGLLGGAKSGAWNFLLKGAGVLIAAEIAREIGPDIAQSGVDLHDAWGLPDPPQWLTDFLDWNPSKTWDTPDWLNDLFGWKPPAPSGTLTPDSATANGLLPGAPGRGGTPAVIKQLASNADRQHKDQRDLIASQREAKAVAERMRTEAASSDAAMLSGIRGLKSQEQSALAASAAQHAQAISRSDAQLARLDSINAKNFSPTVNVTSRVQVDASFTVTATSVARSLRIQQAAQQTTFSGMGGEQRF